LEGMKMKNEPSRAKKGMGGGGKKSSSKSGKHPHETHIRHFKNGGHVVTHSYKNDKEGGGGMESGEPDVMADKAALMQHLQDTVPDNGAAQAAPPDASAAGPAAAGPASAAAPPMPPPVGA
jgi:hypothetical protein